jgi:hypothetical protein
MESPFREIIDGLYREARRTADDGADEQTAGGREVGHGRCEQRGRGREEI